MKKIILILITVLSISACCKFKEAKFITKTDTPSISEIDIIRSSTSSLKN